MFGVSIYEILVVAIVMLICFDKKNPQETKNIIKGVFVYIRKIRNLFFALNKHATNYLELDNYSHEYKEDNSKKEQQKSEKN